MISVQHLKVLDGTLSYFLFFGLEESLFYLVMFYLLLPAYVGASSKASSLYKHAIFIHSYCSITTALFVFYQVLIQDG